MENNKPLIPHLLLAVLLLMDVVAYIVSDYSSFEICVVSMLFLMALSLLRQ